MFVFRASDRTPGLLPMLGKCFIPEQHPPWGGSVEQMFIKGSLGLLTPCLSLQGLFHCCHRQKVRWLGPQPTKKFPVPISGPDTHLNHTDHLPASPTSGGRRGGRWTMGSLRGVLRDPVSSKGLRGWVWSQKLHIYRLTLPPQIRM